MTNFSPYAAGIAMLVIAAVLVLADIRDKRHQWRRGECDRCGLPRGKAGRLCRVVEVDVEVER